jgi:hypothetical protein
MSLITKYTAEAQNPDYTIDSVTVLSEDFALAVGYDAADKQWLILEGRRNEEGICFEPLAHPRYSSVPDALRGVADAAAGYEMLEAQG